MKENFICKHLGHKWIYYSIDGSPRQDVRVCARCHRMQDWKYVLGPNKIWSWTLQYKDLGAKEHVQGYGIK